MRLTVVLAGVLAVSGAWAADPFAGDWKLNLAKSEFKAAAKTGRALIEADNAGGYRQLHEIIFETAPPLRLTTRIQFDGTSEEGTLNDRDVHYSSKRVDANTFAITYRDRETDKISRTMLFSVEPHDHTLTILSTGASSEPAQRMVFDKFTEGPLLEPGKTIEQTFGPGAVYEYRIRLQAGEFLPGNIEPKGGGVNGAFYGPDGARLYYLGGPAAESRSFGLEAPVAGIYRIALRSPAEAAKSFSLRVESIIPAEKRVPAAPAKEPTQKFVSPRIAALRKEVEAGNRDAVAAFWRAIDKEGAPIFERPDGNDHDGLVTFLWRGSPATRNVLILWGPYAFARPADYAMVHLGGTDIWYRTLVIRRGARFVYQLSPNDPLVMDQESFVQRRVTAQADPLNPHKWLDNPFSTKFEYNSAVEMPGARPQLYSTKRDGVPAGKIEKSRIKSALLENEHSLSIYTPPGYRKDGPPNGLLVVFDESSYLTLVPTPTILDNLVAEKKIPPMVAVLIGNPNQETRTRELPPNPKFADFLNNELIPWVRQNYNVTSDPTKVVVAGSSFGGIASVYAGLRHPETFGNILCQSGSFWWAAAKPEPYTEPNFLAKEFLKSPKLPLRFYMDAGSFEVDLNGGGGSILEPSRHMRDVLLAKGYEVHYQENVGGHDYLSWRGSLADGLLALVGTSK
jgi:enterochelin esterase family protein